MLTHHPGQIAYDVITVVVFATRSIHTCRRCLDHWLQGLGLSAGAQAQQAWLSGLLPGLQELSAGTQLPLSLMTALKSPQLICVHSSLLS